MRTYAPLRLGLPGRRRQVEMAWVFGLILSVKSPPKTFHEHDGYASLIFLPVGQLLASPTDEGLTGKNPIKPPVRLEKHNRALVRHYGFRMPLGLTVRMGCGTS